MKKSPFKAGEKTGQYITTRPVCADEIVSMARRLISRRFNRGRLLVSPHDTRDYLLLKLAHLEHESFCGIFLDQRHRVLAFEQLFNGTIDGASVHPREVVKRAIQLNAAAMIFAHNHPSGNAEPSRADEAITRRLKDALALVDIRVLDHLVIGGTDMISLAERGLI